MEGEGEGRMEKGGWRKRGKKNIRELLQLPLLRTPGQKPLSWTLTLWTPYLQNWCIHGINNFTATNYCSCLFEEPWITRHRRPNPQKAERMKCLSAPGAPLPAAAGPERVAQPRLLACVRVNTAAPLQIGEVSAEKWLRVSTWHRRWKVFTQLERCLSFSHRKWGAKHLWESHWREGFVLK